MPSSHGSVTHYIILRRTLNRAYFRVLNDREIRHSLILLPAEYALLDGRIRNTRKTIRLHVERLRRNGQSERELADGHRPEARGRTLCNRTEAGRDERLLPCASSLRVTHHVSRVSRTSRQSRSSRLLIRIRMHATAHTPGVDAQGLIDAVHAAMVEEHEPHIGWIVCVRRRRPFRVPAGRS